MLNVDVKQS